MSCTVFDLDQCIKLWRITPPPPNPNSQFMDASQLDFIYQVNKPYSTIKGCGCRRKEIQLRTVLYQLTAKQRQTAATRCKQSPEYTHQVEMAASYRSNDRLTRKCKEDELYLPVHFLFVSLPTFQNHNIKQFVNDHKIWRKLGLGRFPGEGE